MSATAQAAGQELREFRATYREHHRFVWHALHRFGMETSTVEDALQDVFIIAYRRRGTRRSYSMKAWLYGIARRVASNYRRADRRRTARVDALLEVQADGPRPTPEAIVALDRQLATLSGDDRELFILSELEGLSGPEIAALQRRNVNTVYTRIRKLRGTLRGVSVRRSPGQRPPDSLRGWVALVPMLRGPKLALGGLGASGGVALGGWIGSAAAVAAVIAVVTVIATKPVEQRASSRPSTLEGPLEATASVGLEPQPRPVSKASVVPTPIVGPQTPAAPPAPSTRRRARRSPEPPAGPVESTLAEENALLDPASRALRARDYATALRLSDEHAAAFPRSALADVRAAVRVQALCGLGKVPQARAEAQALVRRRPMAAVVRRLETSCAAPRNPTNSDTAGT